MTKKKQRSFLYNTLECINPDTADFLYSKGATVCRFIFLHNIIISPFILIFFFHCVLFESFLYLLLIETKCSPGFHLRKFVWWFIKSYSCAVCKFAPTVFLVIPCHSPKHSRFFQCFTIYIPNYSKLISNKKFKIIY